MLRQLFDMEPIPEDKIENCKVRRSFMNLAPISRYVWQDELDNAVSFTVYCVIIFVRGGPMFVAFIMNEFHAHEFTSP